MYYQRIDINITYLIPLYYSRMIITSDNTIALVMMRSQPCLDTLLCTLSLSPFCTTIIIG